MATSMRGAPRLGRMSAEPTERAAGVPRRGIQSLKAGGQAVVDRAIREADAALSRVPPELRTLAMASATGQLPQTAAGMLVRRMVAPAIADAKAKWGRPGSAQRRQTIAEAKQQTRAAASGFVDEATFGLADRTLSAGDALADGGFDGWSDRYAANIATKKREDAYDAERYGLARGAGRVAGFGATVAVLGAPGVLRGAVAGVPRAARLVEALNTSRHGLDSHGLVTLAATGGAGAGLASQTVSDVISGRPRPAGEYASAALGGAAGGLATLRYGPVRGGAVGGAVAAAARGPLARRVVTANDIIDSGRTGAIIGGLGSTLGAVGTQRLGPNTTGRIGELMSVAKTVARGDGIPFKMGKRFNLERGGHTFTDLQFKTKTPGKVYGIGESKLGPTTVLRPRQLQARAQGNVDYVVDGWKYSDVGKVVGASLSPFGEQIEDERQFAPFRRGRLVKSVQKLPDRSSALTVY